ncbi:MAG: enoyl-CoA hydratase/isomerase family protein [Blastocatellia bacterium]
MSDRMLVALENGVKRITFNNPMRRNSIDFDTIERLTEAIRQSAEDGTRVIILTGTGDSFCAGADLQSLGGGGIDDYDVTESLRKGINPGILAMRALPIPIIARVHGHAAGVGCNYALASDLIIASDQAFFGQVFIKIALMPDGGGTYFLPRLVGYNKAFELMALGDPISAQEALDLGLINRIVPADDLDKVVDALAARLAAAPAIAIAKIKHSLQRNLESDLAAALDFEAVNQGDCFRSSDFKEGVAAFLQKRRAVFTGK